MTISLPGCSGLWLLRRIVERGLMDDPALRTFYRSALMIAGYRVVTAVDGIDALHRMEAYGPAAVVLDLTLPRLSGRDVGREILNNPHFRHIPIIVVTGADTTDLNASHYACILKKPVTLDALVKAVEACIRDR